MEECRDLRRLVVQQRTYLRVATEGVATEGVECGVYDAAPRALFR